MSFIYEFGNVTGGKKYGIIGVGACGQAGIIANPVAVPVVWVSSGHNPYGLNAALKIP